MSENDLKQFMDGRMSSLFHHYISCQSRYQAIWSKYERQMPACIETCTKEKVNYPEHPDLDGPQGIYWVGEHPKILFVGREHFGWYGSSKWETDKHFICYAPLEFAYFTVPSMGTYWAVIKELINGVLGLELSNWDDVLRNVAFSNACKCLTYNRTFQWFLHQQCAKQAYLQHEITTVGSPMNVLFTKSYDLSRNLFPDQSETLEESEEFFVTVVGKQTIIECSHPGRQSKDWRARLMQKMKQYLKRAEQNSGIVTSKQRV